MKNIQNIDMDENEWHPSWQYDAAELPAHWGDWVAEHRVAFQEAGVHADWIRARLDGPAHLPAADQEFLINLRVAEHNNPDEATFAQAGNHVMIYSAYASAAVSTSCLRLQLLHPQIVGRQHAGARA